MTAAELTLRVTLDAAPRALEVLRTVLGLAGWVELPFVQADLDSEAETATAGVCRVRALLEDRPDADAALAEVLAALDRLGVAVEGGHRPVELRDWAESWKENFGVERFGRIVLAPSWLPAPTEEGAIVLRLDPGLGFGTGKHATTRMCLEALERVVRAGMRVLDVGCGSGILALAAAKLGASVDAVDVDPDCVRVAQQNAEHNEVASRVRVQVGSVGARWPFPHDAASPGYDVVVANIMTGVLIGLSPSLVAAVRSGGAGRLIASGIVADRRGEVVAALVAHGGRVLAERVQGEWCCLEATTG